MSLSSPYCRCNKSGGETRRRKSNLLRVCIVLASFAVFTPSASATTLFGINFDFQSAGGEDTGGAFLQFDVDPLALPFDQSINLTSDPSVQFNLFVQATTSPFQSFVGFATEASDVAFFMEIFVEDLNPLFPIQIVGDPGLSGELINFSFNSFDQFGIEWATEFVLFDDGSYVLVGQNFDNFDDFSEAGTWSAGMWFDDPIPAVPAPATGSLLGSGLALLAWMRRKAT